MTENRNGYQTGEGEYESEETMDGAYKEFPPEVLAMLEEDLDPTLVSSYNGPGGKELSYIEAHAAITNANRIFGHGAWGPRVLEGPTLHSIKISDPSTGVITDEHFYYTARVGIWVYGHLRSSDEGFGEVDDINEGTKSTAMLGMHEKARKGAISDGIKRALRSFGKQFGNDLYSDSGSGGSSTTHDPMAPACHKHGAGNHVRESSRGNGYYCSRKDSTTPSGFCEYTPRVPDASPPASKEEAAARPAQNPAPARTAPARTAPATAAAPQANPQPYGAEDDWDYVDHASTAQAPGPTPVAPAPAAPAAPSDGATAIPAALKDMSKEQLLERYVEIGAQTGRSRGDVFTILMRKTGKPASQATTEDLQQAVAEAEAAIGV